MSEQLNVDTNRTYNSNINHNNQRIDNSGFLPIQEIKTADISRVLTKETLQTSSTSLTTSNCSNSPTNLASFEEDDEEDNTSLFEFLYDETTEGNNTNNGGGGELLSLPLSTLELPVTPPVDEQEQQLKQAAVAVQQAPEVQSGLLPIETCAATLLTPYSSVSLSASSSSGDTLSNNLNSSNYSSSNSLALSTAAAIAQQSSSGATLPGGINSNNLLNLSDIPTSLSPVSFCVFVFITCVLCYVGKVAGLTL